MNDTEPAEEAAGFRRKEPWAQRQRGEGGRTRKELFWDRHERVLAEVAWLGAGEIAQQARVFAT